MVTKLHSRQISHWGISAEYEFALSEGSTLTPSVGFYYSSEYHTSDQQYPIGLQESYTQTDMSLTWRSLDLHWSLSAWIQNLEDELVILRTNIVNANLGTSNIGQSIGNPQTFGITAGYQY